MEQEQLLPTLSIERTTFMVDVQTEQLIQVGQPDNTISFSDMAYSSRGYQFDYNHDLKNIPFSFIGDYTTVHLPPMTELDPVGMARKYGISETAAIGKMDTDLMVDQQQLAMREKGQLGI